jgi:hypothetical protein
MKPRFNLLQLTSLVFTFFLVMAVSCTKENSGDDTAEQEEIQASTVTAESDAEAEVIYSEVFDDAMGANNDVGMADVGIAGRTSEGSPDLRPMGCFTVTVTTPPNTFPARVVIDFGTSPCLGLDGHTRMGKIIITYTARLVTAGAVAEATFENFYFDSTKVQGTHRTTNTSNGTLDRSFKIEVINGKLTHYNGNFIEWNTVKTIAQIEGLATPFMPLDDILKITGSSRGKAKRGNLLVAWESNVVEPLIKKFRCRWINRGRIRSVRANMASNSPWIALLDFGNGACDNQATLTINGVPHQITLR